MVVMERFRRPIRPAWPAGLMIGLTLLSGCTVWRAAPLQSDPLRAVRGKGEIRLTLSDYRQVNVWGAFIAGDSLRGYGREMDAAGVGIVFERPRVRSEYPVSFALKDIRRLERHEIDTGRTVALGIGVAAVAAAAIALAVNMTSFSIGTGAW
jgi:hypothetical protein